jgi:hypothetical protein
MPEQLRPISGGMNANQIRAHGDTKVRILVIVCVSIICGLLSIGGVLAFFCKESSFKDLWVIIGPIITAGLTGLTSILINKESGHKS